jgi:hypothetical protein
MNETENIPKDNLLEISDDWTEEYTRQAKV